MMADMAGVTLPSANGERTTVNWHDHQVTALKPDPPECPPVKLVWCGGISGEVGVMGSWDGWSKVWKLNRSETGEYSVALKIPCGQHEYKFLVNNTWFHDETKPTVSNSFGTLNNLVNVVKLSNGPVKAGINGAPKKCITDKIPNGTNQPLQPSEPTLPNKTEKESYKQKTTAATTNTTTPQIQEICKLEPAKESCNMKTTTGTDNNNMKAPQIQEICKPEPTSLGDTGSGPYATPTSNGPADSAQAYGKGDMFNKEPVQQTCPIPKTTANKATRPAVPPKPGNSTTNTASSAVNSDPLLTTKATFKDVCVVEPVQQKFPQSQTTAHRVPPAKSLPKAPTKATTTAPPQNARARPEVPPKRTAEKTGKPVVGTVGGTRNPEAAPPRARTTVKQPPATKPKPTQRRVVTSQAAPRLAGKTVDGKGPSSQPGQAETRDKRSRTRMADRSKECSPLAGKGSSTAVKAGAEDSIPVTFVLSSKGRTSGDVVILGSWDDWSQAKKLDNKEDTLEACLDLPSGDYEYKFKMGKTWFCDTTKPVVPNVFGTLNNYIEVVKEPDGGSATSFPETVQVTHLDPETLQKALAKVSEETQSSESEFEKTDERSIAGGDDKNSTTFVEDQTVQEDKVSEEKEASKDEAEKTDESDIVEGDDRMSATCVEDQTIQENKVSEEKETSKDGVEKTDESTIAECVRISATCSDEQTIQENKVSEEKEAPEDKIEKTDESGIAEKDDKISSTCAEEQAIQEDTEPTVTVAPQQFIIQDSLMSICMTPDMPPPVTVTTHEDKVLEEKEKCKGEVEKTDESDLVEEGDKISATCVEEKTIQENKVSEEKETSKDGVEKTDESTIAECVRISATCSDERTIQGNKVSEEKEASEDKIEKTDESGIAEKDDKISSTCAEEQAIQEDTEPTVTVAPQQFIIQDSLMSICVTPEMPPPVTSKQTTHEGKDSQETVSRGRKRDEPTVCVCRKPVPIPVRPVPQETTSEDAIESESVDTPETTSQDETAAEGSEDTSQKSDETAQQHEEVVKEAQPELTMETKVIKVEQTAVSMVERLEEKDDIKTTVQEPPQMVETLTPDVEKESKERVTPDSVEKEDNTVPEAIIVKDKSAKEAVLTEKEVKQDEDEETVSQETKKDEPVICICYKPTPVTLVLSPETTSEDAIEPKSVATTETTSQDTETVADVAEVTDEKSKETAQQEEVVETQPETSMETKVIKVEQTAVSMVERLEEKDDIKTTAQETTQMGETLTPDVEKESKERFTPDSVEKEDNTVPVASMIKDTTGKEAALVEKEVKPDERAEDEETVSREGETDEPVIAICYKPTPVTLVLPPETTSEDKIESKSVATTDITSQDKTVGDVAEGTDKKSDETAQQQEVKVLEEQPESSMDEEVGKPVEQAAYDTVQKVESVEVSMETPLRDEKVEVIDEKSEEVAQDIKEKPDEKVSNEETPKNEATERPDLDVSDKSEEKTPSETPQPDETVDEGVVDIVVQSIDETVVKAAPAAGETFEENIHTEVTLPDETIKTTVPCTVAAPEEIDETNVLPPQEITIQEAVTNLETVATTESPIQDKEETETDIVTATEEPASSEIQQQPDETSGKAVADTVHEVSPDIAEKVDSKKATAKVETSHDTVLVVSEDVSEKGPSELPPAKQLVEVVVLDSAEKLDDTAQTETTPSLPTGVPGNVEKVTSETEPKFEPTQKDAPGIAEEVKVITVKITKEPQTGKPFKAAALQSKTYAQAVKESMPEVEKTVQENVDMSDVGETHQETPPKDKSVDETVPENVELPKEEVTEMLPLGTVEDTVSEKEELTKEKIHINAPSEDKIIKTIVEPQSVEFGEEKVHTETPQPDKPVVRAVSEKTEEPKKEIHTETPPEDKTPENAVLQQQVEVVEEEKEEVQVVVQEKVQRETLSDKSVETKVSETVDESKEEIHTATPPENKTVEETVQHIKVEVTEETIHTEIPPTDKPVVKEVSEKMEAPKEEIHTETPPEDKTPENAVLQQQVEVVEEEKEEVQVVVQEKVQTETLSPDKTVETKVSEKMEGLEEEDSIETPPEDKRVEETVQPQQVSEVLEETIHTKAPSPDKPVVKKVSEKVEEPKEEIHTEAPSEDKTAEKTVQPQNVEVTEEKVHTETPQPDKPVQRVVSEKTEEPKKEIHTETPPEDKTPENTVQQQQVEVVEDEKEEVQVVVQEKVQTETPPADKPVETRVSEKTEGLEEEVSIETPPEDKTVEETVKPQVSEVLEETIQTEAPDKPVDEKVSEKVEEAKEEIHTEAPPEDKIIMTTVQPQNVEVVEETIHTETPPPEKTVEIIVSEKTEVVKKEVHTETPSKDKSVKTTVQPQQVKVAEEKDTETVEAPKEESHTETPPDTPVEKKVLETAKVSEEKIHTEAQPTNKTATETAPPKVEPCYKTIHEILMEDTTEKIPLFEYTQFTLICEEETSGDVVVQGSWDGWKEAFKLNKSEDGSYSESVMLPYGLHEYKYRVGNTWIHDEAKAAVRNAFGTINNVLRVPAEAGGKDSLDIPQEEDSDLEECMRVRLDWTGEASGDVFVSGSWDGWTRSWKLKKRNDNEYSVSLTLPCRQHQYKLRAGNSWFYDTTKPTVPNSFGTFNNTIEVAAAPAKMAKPWGKRKLTDF
ncbi:uncharacterized protein LOC144866873 [Branchiostoma floridae x Branchiostoma japonicum]